MPQYILFAGQSYYPWGGWEDIVSAGTLDECKAAFGTWDRFEWGHIVNLSTMCIEMIAQGDEAGAVSWVQPDADHWYWRDQEDRPMADFMRKNGRWPKI